MEYKKANAEVIILNNADILTNSNACEHGNSKRCNNKPGKNTDDGCTNSAHRSTCDHGNHK